MRPLMVALAGAGTSWLVTLLVLGSNGLQSAVSDGIAGSFIVPMAPFAATGAAFIAAAAVGWYTCVVRHEFRDVLAYLLAFDLVLVAASVVAGGELSFGRASVVFVVVSSWGLQFLAVGLAVRLAAGAGLGSQRQ